MTLTPPQTKRWRRVEYERLVDVGIFLPGEPVELLGGNLIVAEPQGTRHVTAVRRASRALGAAFLERAARPAPPSGGSASRSPAAGRGEAE